MPDPAPADQVPPPPPTGGYPTLGRNRVVVGAGGLGLIALAVVLLTLPTGEPDGDSVVRKGTPENVALAPPPVRLTAPAPAPTAAPAQPQSVATQRNAPLPVPPAAPAEISAAALPRTAAIKVDGKATSRRRFVVSPGRHVLEVAQPGYLSRSDTLQVDAGQHVTWSPKLVPAPQPRTAVAPVPAPRRGSGDETACRQDMSGASWRDARVSCGRAAEAGSAVAERNVAVLFQHGYAVNRSDDSAARWFAQAARNGDAEAMFQLAGAYDRGRGVRKDQTAALDWYTRAGGNGHADAAYLLGEVYEKGRMGVAKDRTKALDWYRKAAAAGSTGAANKVRELTR